MIMFRQTKIVMMMMMRQIEEATAKDIQARINISTSHQMKGETAFFAANDIDMCGLVPNEAPLKLPIRI